MNTDKKPIGVLKDELVWVSKMFGDFQRNAVSWNHDQQGRMLYTAVCNRLAELYSKIYKTIQQAGGFKWPDLHHGAPSGKESHSAFMEEAGDPPGEEPVRYGYPEHQPWPEDPGAPHPNEKVEEFYRWCGTLDSRGNPRIWMERLHNYRWPPDPRAPSGIHLHPFQNDIIKKLIRQGKTIFIPVGTGKGIDPHIGIPEQGIVSDPAVPEFNTKEAYVDIRMRLKNLPEPAMGEYRCRSAVVPQEPQYPQLHVWAKELTEAQQRLVASGAKLFIHEPKEVKMTDIKPGVPRKHMPKKMRIALLEQQIGYQEKDLNDKTQQLARFQTELRNLGRRFEDHLAKNMPEKIEGMGRKIVLHFNSPLTRLILSDDKGMKVASEEVVNILLNALRRFGDKSESGTPLKGPADPSAELKGSYSGNPAPATPKHRHFEEKDGSQHPGTNICVYGRHKAHGIGILRFGSDHLWHITMPGDLEKNVHSNDVIWYKEIL